MVSFIASAFNGRKLVHILTWCGYSISGRIARNLTQIEITIFAKYVNYFHSSFPGRFGVLFIKGSGILYL